MTVKDEMKVELRNSKDVYEIMRNIYEALPEQDRQKEIFYIAGLNTKNVIEYIEMVSMGHLSASLVHPREVFRVAIMKNSASILACHNHPSGDPSPSADDITITKRLQEAGRILGIDLLDHIIIGNGVGPYISLMEKGMLR